MRVRGMSAEDEHLYFVCLEDWSDEMKESGDRKRRWYENAKKDGLRVKLAEDDKGVIGGMIQYMPIEHSFVKGQDMYLIYCIWVHGYKQGRGDFRKRGMGKALLEAAEADARALGAKGMAAWGLSIPVWMRASWFKKHGYSKADKVGGIVLMWKSFASDAQPPEWVRENKKPAPAPGKVTVTSLISGWCPAQNIVYERAKRVSAEFGDSVVFQEFDTSDRNVFLEWGNADALYVDGRPVRTGPPPSAEKIRSIIRKRAKRLKK